MNARNLTLAVFAAISVTASAQMQDVTSQYIANPGFESCTPLEPGADGVVSVVGHWNTFGGTDYSGQGWALVEQLKGSNAAVVGYGTTVKYGSYSTATSPIPTLNGTEGSNVLCFTGNKSVTYTSAREVTLPAGSYRLTVNVYPAHLSTSSMPSVVKVWNTTGFVASDGTEYLSVMDEKHQSDFRPNVWQTDVIDIQLTAPTKGFFQLNYGCSYYVAIDDLKLEYENRVITASLEQVIRKAKSLRQAMKGNDALLEAIADAEAFVQSPTSQADVEVQCGRLYDAMSAALATATTVVDITAAYMENPSFETGSVEPWTGVASVDIPSTALPVTPNIDGSFLADVERSGSACRLQQTIEHLPAGRYLADAQIAGRASIVLGSSTTSWQGGADGLFLRGHSAVASLTAPGTLVVGATATSDFSIDNFRLLYAPTDEALRQAALAAVQADARNFLSAPGYAAITGSERTALAEAAEATDGNVQTLAKNINTALAAFVDAKSDYNKLVAARQNAAAYTTEAYPYGALGIFDGIRTLVATTATSRQHALELRDQLNAACFQFYVSNAYCEGAYPTDYTGSISVPNASGTTMPVVWRRQNMQVRTDKSAWTNPKTGEQDQAVYGVTADYYRTGKDQTAFMWQNVSGLPAGQYVLSVTAMCTATLHPEVLIDGNVIGTINGVGTYGGGVYGGGWVENVITFQKDDDADIELRLQSTLTSNYQEWYVDNLRLYRVEGDATGISTAPFTADAAAPAYDLAGRRTATTAKGIYIIAGKKVLK